MKIIHPISFNIYRGRAIHHDPVKSRQDFACLGVELTPPDQIGLMCGQVSEDHPQWPEIEKLIQQYNASGIVRTEFSREDLLASPYLHVGIEWHDGFPQPEDDFGYIPKTYDTADYCGKCGLGAKQNNPFRLEKEPVWKKYSALQLHWVFSEIFLSPEAWKSVFEPEGIPCRPVVLHSSGKVSDKVVQLDITQTAELDMEGYAFEACEHCKRKKYLPVRRGYCPRPLRDVDAPIFKSTQFLGSGMQACPWILITPAFYRKLESSGLKGFTFGACRPK